MINNTGMKYRTKIQIEHNIILQILHSFLLLLREIKSSNENLYEVNVTQFESYNLENTCIAVHCPKRQHPYPPGDIHPTEQ